MRDNVFHIKGEAEEMCWLCEHPSATKADYHRMIIDLIETHGWIAQGVEGNAQNPPFTYTVGRSAHDLPELIITGLTYLHAHQLFTAVLAQLSDPAALQPGDQLTVRGTEFEVVAVADPREHLITAVELYGTNIRALQLIHTNASGVWPWSPFYVAPYLQPVLGPRAADTTP